MDNDAAINCTGSGSPRCSWSTSWVLGSSDLLDPGEQVDMTVTLTLLSALIKNKEFTIQVIPNKGDVVIVNRTISAEIKAKMSLN